MADKLDEAAEIRLHVQLEKSDYVRAARDRFWRTLGWTVLIAPLLATLPYWRRGLLQHELANANAGALMVALGLYLATAVFFAFSIELCARSFGQHAVRKAPLALQPQLLSFSARGVKAVTNRSSAEVPWSTFRKVTRTRWAFQLHLQGGRYVLVPFRQMSSDQERMELGRLIKEQLGDRARFAD